MNSGSAMRAFTGICATGMISQMLQTKMKLNIVSSKRRVAQPSGPIVCRMMPLRMKSTARLGDVLHAGRHELPACGCATNMKPEHEDDREPHQQDDLVHAEGALRR